MTEKKVYKQGEQYKITLTEEMANQLNVLEKLGLTQDNTKLASLTFETKEYEKLDKLAGNRTIKRQNVKAKKVLLQDKGFKSTNPVVVNNRGEIIDGQHRRLAAQELEIPYKFTVDTSLDAENSLEATIELNNSGKPWGIEDYVHAYAEVGNDNYQKLLDLKDELETTLSRTLLLYLGHKPSSAYSKQTINVGKFKFTETRAKDARRRAKELSILLNAVDNPTYKVIVKSEGFYKAYLELSRAKGFKFKIIREQFEKMRYTFLDPRELPRTLVETYNYKRQAATKLMYDPLNLGGTGTIKKIVEEE